jgi:hypothetical protein
MPAYSKEDADKAFADLDATLKAEARKGGGGPADLCKTYGSVRTGLQKIIEILGSVTFIPYAGTIATALKLLMGIADTACHIGS